MLSTYKQMSNDVQNVNDTFTFVICFTVMLETIKQARQSKIKSQED